MGSAMSDMSTSIRHSVKNMTKGEEEEQEEKESTVFHISAPFEGEEQVARSPRQQASPRGPRGERDNSSSSLPALRKQKSSERLSSSASAQRQMSPRGESGMFRRQKSGDLTVAAERREPVKQTESSPRRPAPKIPEKDLTDLYVSKIEFAEEYDPNN